MDKFYSKLVALISVKSIVTLILTAVFAVLSANGKVDVREFMTIYTVVIAFYFGTQAARKEKEG